MSGQNTYSDPVKSPEIQETILSNRIGIISAELSKRLRISPSEALQLFYGSKTCAGLHDKETGLYLYGDLYIADEFMRIQRKLPNFTEVVTPSRKVCLPLQR